MPGYPQAGPHAAQYRLPDCKGLSHMDQVLRDARRGLDCPLCLSLYDSSEAVSGADLTRIRARPARHGNSARRAAETGIAAALPPPTNDTDQPMTTFVKTVLFTDSDGRARFREEHLALTEGSPQSMLSPVFPAAGYQLRESPVGFRSQFHCTHLPQWVFVLSGQMEIGLQDGSTRIFGAGQHFYSADVLPAGASFDANIHGHWSRQAGADALQTLFVKG